MPRPAKARARKPLLSTRDSLIYQLWVATNLTARPFSVSFGKRLRINLTDWRILLTVADAPGTSAQALAEYCGLDKMTVSRAVCNLEAQGRVVRQGNETDRRMRHLYLTDAGWSVYDAIVASAMAREAELSKALTSAEVSRFKALLLKVSTQARNGSSSPGAS